MWHRALHISTSEDHFCHHSWIVVSSFSITTIIAINIVSNNAVFVVTITTAAYVITSVTNTNISVILFMVFYFNYVVISTFY